MPEEEYNESPNNMFGRTPFDYKTILLIHLRNMSALLTAKVTVPIHDNVNYEFLLNYSKNLTDINFTSSVRFLDALLQPYKDKKYYDEIKTLKEDKTDARMAAILRLGAIVGLMNRLNLLLEEERKDFNEA